MAIDGTIIARAGEGASDVWTPSPAFRGATNWQRFIDQAGLASYEALCARAASDPDWFWTALIRFLDVRFSRPFERVLDLSDGPAWPRWCVGGRANLTVSCLDRHLPARAAHPALVWEGEDGTVRTWTYAELHRETCRLAAGLHALGLRQGDVVGISMPMLPETAAAFLALARLGCITLPLFSGFGAEAVAARLEAGGAVAAIIVARTRRRGQDVPMKAILDAAAPHVPTLRTIVVLGEADGTADLVSGRDHLWADVVSASPEVLPPADTEADAPLMVIYTSGTTGRPKGTVHTHCGFGVKTGQDYQLCFDLKPEDRLLWMSDFGWLVGPGQIVATTLAGATLVMVEGAPDFPDRSRMWRVIERHAVSVLGTSPTLARLLMRGGDAEVHRHDLGSLRVAASTGEPWDDTSWRWMFRTVLGGTRPLMNYSGGTEIGGILATNPLYPIRPASFHGPIPGTGAVILNEAGQEAGVGETGELAMGQACIGTTRGLWQDTERYMEGYWSRFPGFWVHGDWASRDSAGTWFIHGRSDDTIKIAGKRTGPAEIEAILMATGLVEDAAAVAVPHPVKGAALVCVVVRRDGSAATPVLADAVAEGLGSAFRPTTIHVVSSLPKTRNMKTMRRVVRAVLLGDDPGDLTALVNPESVQDLRRCIICPRSA